ncbi:LEAF RUST 10 DISEASE-RESISTANCE LOCUS RECEPTOR-LIKE PROTEIN KINASE-like 1.5 [Vigna unguiculata]|uniref:LEAF RUST 10 DISEASE-RESISTANCE LOCUS RECEPTOR-LIKE PROTEIN KINASE-like 1.5 n=1 Tax=Vigna unguiculata TaxID=3917 RepID=UPI0010168C98|nr:LEAF RUST 10 DISEASE-RESISTANCE LOCUS RECEPTOR-LIKE PROTEIN KINASE-like 1.5 [Vigna unguiculata]
MSSSIVIIFLFLSLFRPCNTQTCSSNNTNPCPPFSSHPPFPFSSTPGCGHPSFHITCSSPHSFISINNLSFSILSYNSNTSSITLSPRPNPTPHPNCPSFSFIPTRHINLSATPFRVSAATCSRLSFLRPCSPPSLPNCSHCPSQCHLIKSPSHLLPDCRSTHHSPQYSDSPCLTDILGFLQQFLKNGIQLDWDQSRDPYFTNCTICRANNSTCGFGSLYLAQLRDGCSGCCCRWFCSCREK